MVGVVGCCRCRGCGSGRREGVGGCRRCECCRCRGRDRDGLKVSAVVGVAMVAATVGRLSGVGEAARGVGSLCAVGLEKIRAVGSQGPESVRALRWSRRWSALSGGRGSDRLATVGVADGRRL